MSSPSYYCYRKPFPDTVSERIESNSIAHVGDECFAVDFLVAEGTLVLAAADGVVLAIKDDSDVGGPDEEYADAANYVILHHGCGETSIVIHLKKQSVRVCVGQEVKAGDVLAFQGSTGWTYEPHIHFAVYRNRVTVPIRFL